MTGAVATGSRAARAPSHSSRPAVERPRTRRADARPQRAVVPDPHFAPSPEATCARRACRRCLQVTGCTGAGLLTEDEWSDVPGAAAWYSATSCASAPWTMRRRTGDQPVQPFRMGAEWLDISAPPLAPCPAICSARAVPGMAGTACWMADA